MPSGGRQGRSPAQAAGAGKIAQWWHAQDGAWRAVMVSSVVLLAAAVVTVGLLTGQGGGAPAPRARQYLAFTACLLTGPAGLSGATAAAAWGGMEQASLKTHAGVQYLPVMSGTTAAAAGPFLASLLMRHCGLVIAAGAAQVASVEAVAPRYRSERFAVLGGGAAGPNVAVVRGSRGMRAAVARLVSAAVSASRQ
jgi:basic membrane lipoprotein Med (substrate-binding protein (PBP1-ABC) superfamily)